MKFVIATQELNYMISKCQNAVAAKPTVPVLANILVVAKDGEITFTATDLNLAIRCSTEAKILEEGVTTLPTKSFVPLIRELTAVNVEIYTDENHVTEVIADSSRFKLHGKSPAEYPELPDLSEAVRVVVPQEQIKDMLHRTSFAVSKVDNRYSLTGVSVHVANGKATFVGTDGKRLARSFTTVSLDPSFTGSYIIPIKAVDEIQKNLSSEGEAELYLLSDKIGLRMDDTLIIVKLLTGDYPDVTRVIPEKAESVISIHREELMTLLRQISLFTPDSAHSVRFSFGDGELRLSANTMDVGEGHVSMPVNYHGSQLDVAYNPGFFLDILRHTKNETVKMGVIDAYNPGMLTDAEEVESPSLQSSPLFVLMPMRLNEE